MIVTLAFGVAIIIFTFVIFPAINRSVPVQTLSDCASSDAIEGIRQALAEAPAGKILGLKIVDVGGYSELSRTATEVRCSATVKLNNAQEGKLMYRLYVQGDRVFIEARLPISGL